MRIAQIAPMYEAVPPSHYGGTERVVWNLCEELVRLGHDVTLFASGDSHTSARLCATTPRSLRRQMNRTELEQISPYMHYGMLSAVFERAAEFDVIHSHCDHITLPFMRLSPRPTLLTMHGRLDLPLLRAIMPYYPDAPIVSISMAQRAPWADMPISWAGTVYNGVALDHFTFQPERGEYLVFLGRIAPEKRPDLAVEIARRTGMPLKVAAKVDPVDQCYWETEIAPLFAANGVEYLGEVDERGKSELLGGAYATLFPIDWPEPFGLVMVESLACGTPVLALNRGSVPEVLRDGVSGFICETIDELVAAVPRAAQLDRYTCWLEAQRFSSAAMAAGYEELYYQMIAKVSARLVPLSPRRERAVGLGMG